MNRDSNTNYIPLDDIDSTIGEEEIIEIPEKNDEELLIPKNTIPQIDVEENEEENSSQIDVLVDNNSNSNENEAIQNPFIPSTSTASISAEASNSNSVQKKIKNSFLSEFKFFRKSPKKTFAIHSIDGVFSNLNEKPEVRSDALPTYTQISGESDFDPLYGHEVVFCRYSDICMELLIDNLTPGSWPGFMVSIFIVMSLDLLGFLMTLFFSSSHGSKKGAFAGLSMLFLKYGYFVMPVNVNENYEGASSMNEEINELYSSERVGYTLIILAVLLLFYSISKFKKILKIQEYAYKYPDQIREIQI